MTILGIETSCDETSAAVLREGKIGSNIISSQFIHRKYGGVVPELASRAHQQLIVSVVDEALKVARAKKQEIEGIAVTQGPGLIGALLVGVNFAKALAYGLKIPIIGINHLEAHIYANFIDEPRPAYPFLCLLVSGGHTQLILVEENFHHTILGETLDDAAGEAYDKVAKTLGLGFPGGPIIDKLAQEGNPRFVAFPRSLLEDDSFDFSFSGIKTAVLYWLRDHHALSSYAQPITENHELLTNICASFQQAVADVLVEKTLRVCKRYAVKGVAIAGGVSANVLLRRMMQERCSVMNIPVFIPKLEYCTDNAAMIAMLGLMKLQKSFQSDIEMAATASFAVQ